MSKSPWAGPFKPLTKQEEARRAKAAKQHDVDMLSQSAAGRRVLAARRRESERRPGA